MEIVEGVNFNQNDGFTQQRVRRSDHMVNSGVERAITRIESDLSHVRENLRDFKKDMSEFRSDIKDVQKEMKADIKDIRKEIRYNLILVLGTLSSFTIGLCTIMAKGFGWF